MKYEVWMGFRNYLGEVYDESKVAEFNSETRVRQYVAFCESDAEDDAEVYSVREK